jgi:hypothetical protein
MALVLNKKQEVIEINESSPYVKVNLGEVGSDFKLLVKPISELQLQVILYEFTEDLKEKNQSIDNPMYVFEYRKRLVKEHLVGWSGIILGDVELQFNEDSLEKLANITEIQNIVFSNIAEKSVIKKNLDEPSKSKQKNTKNG